LKLALAASPAGGLHRPGGPSGFTASVARQQMHMLKDLNYAVLLRPMPVDDAGALEASRHHPGVVFHR